MAGRGNLRVQSEEDDGWGGAGGYMEAKSRKLEQQFNEDAGSRVQSSSIFRGVAIHCDGWTNPSHDDLKMIMSKNGGKYHMYYSRSKTTHVIASNLPHAKRKELKPNQKVVKPEWITDSLKAKQLLPIENYLLVPIEESAQSRITSILCKRRSKDSEPGSSAASKPETRSLSQTSSMDEEDVEKKSSCSSSKDSLDKSADKALNKSSSRTICPTTDSNFLSEFYSHSRLHFLSTWKMELKEYVRSLQSEESLREIPLSGYEKLLEIAKTEGSQPKDHGHVVMHIDMDCFFVSVGLKSRPELRGLPVAVTHSTGTGITSERPDADPVYEAKYYEKKYGEQSKLSETTSSRARTSSSFGPGFSASEIASCSYEARAVGVKNGMFMGKAKQLCPELRVIPYDFEAYRQTSDQLYNTLASFTRHIEAVSCDEALVDISRLVKETGLSPIRVASCIRHAVKDVTGCNASTGVGPNISLARMATRRAKPDGEFMVTQDEAKQFMKSLPVKDLPGVGRSTASRLQEIGLSTCGDLQNYPVGNLKQEFGAKTGQKLHDMSCGIDKREVEIEKERKSVSAEVNYGIRLSNEEETKKFLQNLAKEVTNRLKSAGMRGRRVTLKLMVRRPDAPQESVKFGGHGICDSLSRSSQISLKNKGDLFEEDCAAIYETAWTILSSLQLNVSDLRGIGIQVTQLQPAESSSTNNESSSAAFLKKFMVKKSDLPAPIVEKIKIDNPPSTSGDATSRVSREDVEQRQNGNTLNLSFLDALPPELRKEVEQNLVQQREALERNFLNNENSNDSTGSGFAVVDESSRGSVSNVLFCEQGKLFTATRPTKKPTASSSRGRPRGSKTKSSKASTSKLISRKTRNSDTSPNKLITDMFPVTYSPSKPNSAKSSPAGRRKISPARSIAQNNLASAAVNKAKRRLISIVEENEKIEILDSDEENFDPQFAEDANDNFDPPPPEDLTDNNTKESSVPKLGGAFKIEAIRQVLSEWIDAFAENGPLDCDIDDFIKFLTRTANELRDLEKIHLTLRSFRRKLTAISNQVQFKENFSNWTKAYSRVCENIQCAIRDGYRGGELNILPL